MIFDVGDVKTMGFLSLHLICTQCNQIQILLVVVVPL